MRRESERERADTDLSIIFLIFCYSSHTYLLGFLSSNLHSGSGNTFSELTKNGCWNFRLSSHYHIWTLFLTLFSILSFSQLESICICSWYIFVSNSGICCYPSLDLGKLLIHFPIYFSLIVLFSLYLCDYLEPLSHICPSFSTVLWSTNKST